MAEIRPGVTTLVATIKFLCRFINRHAGSIRIVLEEVLTPEQLAVYDNAVTAIAALCAVFNIVYPLIKP